jgi:hypothetical protein
MPVVIDQVEVETAAAPRAEPPAPMPARPAPPDRFAILALLRREADRAARLKAD